MLALRLPEEIEIRLNTLAKATGRTKTYYAREAILTHLEDLEDAYMAESAYEAWFRCKVEKSRTAMREGHVLSTEEVAAKALRRRAMILEGRTTQ